MFSLFSFLKFVLPSFLANWEKIRVAANIGEWLTRTSAIFGSGDIAKVSAPKQTCPKMGRGSTHCQLRLSGQIHWPIHLTEDTAGSAWWQYSSSIASPGVS